MNWICQKLCKNLFHGSDRSDEAAKSTCNCLPSEEKAVLTENPQDRPKNTNLKEILDNYRKLLNSASPFDSSDLALQSAEEELLNSLERFSTIVTLPDGERIMIRPILPTDKLVMKDLIETGEISQHSLSLRFYSVVTRVLDSSLDYLCTVDFDTHFAIGVLINEDGKWRGVASGRFIQDEFCLEEAEWAALVVDSKHGHKIGSCILYYLSVMAHNYGINRLMALVHPENYCVLHWMKKLEAFRQSKNECYYWVFSTPIFPAWIASEEARESLEKAARGQSEASEEIREQLRKDVQNLAQYKKSAKDQQSYLNSRKKV